MTTPQSSSPADGRALETLRALRETTILRPGLTEVEVIQAVVRQLEALGLRGAISMLSEDGQTLVVRELSFPARKQLAALERLTGLRAVGFSFPTSRADVYRRVVETGQYAFVPDSAAVIAQLAPEAARRWLDRILDWVGPQQSAFAPICARGRVVGVLNASAPTLEEADQIVVQAFAAQVGAALEHAWLLAETRASRDAVVRAEAVLRESEARYHTLFENAGDALFILDLNGRFLNVNQVACDRLGYSREELLQMTPLDIDTPEYAARVAERMEMLRQQGQMILETVHVRRDGTHLPVELSSRLVEYAGAPAVLTIARDITERKRAEAAEREQRTLAEALRDTAAVLNTTLEFDAVLDYILATVGRVVPHDTANIMLVEGGVARVVRSRGYAGRGPAGLAPDIRYPLADFPDLRRMAESGEALAIPDTRSYPGWVERPETAWIRSHLGAPIRFKGQVIGFLNLAGTTPGFFSPAQAARLQAFADQAATALANARLLRETRDSRDAVLNMLEDLEESARQLRDKTDRLTALGEIARLASSSLDTNAVMEAVTHEVRRLIPCNHASIALVDRAGEQIVIQSASIDGTSQIAAGMRIAFADSIIPPMLETRQPILRPDLSRLERVSGVDEKLLAEGIRSDMVVPLAARGEVIGTINLAAYRPNAFDETHLALAQELAGHVAEAIENARLFEATERRLKQMQALMAIDTAITSSLDLRLTLSVFLDQVITEMGVDAADVLLLNPHLQVLEYAAGRGFRTTALQHTRLRLGEGYAGRAALERQIVRIPNLSEFGQEAGGARRAHELPLRADIPAALAQALSEEGFVTYFGVPLYAKGALLGVLEFFHRAPLNPDADWLVFMEALAGQAAIAIEDAALFEGLQRSNVELMLAYDATIEGWSRALELRDRQTKGHTLRVAELTVRLARAAGMSEAEAAHVRRGALLHDIGKMGIPDSILLEPGPLTEEDWAIMRRHPVYAYEMLSPITFLRSALDIPYCHHEKWDGTGYPRGLTGEQIPLAARLFAVVDVWDALCSERPYRAAWPEERVIEHIRSLSGRHFDPQAVEVFLKTVGEGY